MRDRIAAEPPHEQADLVEAIPARGERRRDPAHIDGVRRHLEWAVDQAERPGPPDVGQPAGPQPGRGVVAEQPDRLGEDEQLAELHRAGRPAGDVGGQFLEQRQGALAAAGGDGVSDVAARRDRAQQLAGLRRAGGQRLLVPVQRLVAGQFPQVRHQPVLAGLDEPVVVELVDGVGQDLALLLEHGEQAAQRVPGVGIAPLVDPGQQFVQSGHGMLLSSRVCGTSGLNTASWAGWMPLATMTCMSGWSVMLASAGLTAASASMVVP